MERVRYQRLDLFCGGGGKKEETNLRNRHIGRKWVVMLVGSTRSVCMRFQFSSFSFYFLLMLFAFLSLMIA